MIPLYRDELEDVYKRQESGEPGGIGVSVPGMGNGTAEPGGDDPGKHGSRPASGHWPHACLLYTSGKDRGWLGRRNYGSHD